MRHIFILALLPLLLLVTECHALTTWDQAEVILEEQNTTDSHNEAALEFSDTQPEHNPIIDVIEQATQKIRRDLAAELDGLLERLPQIIQGPPPPARVVEAKAGQQLVWAADAAVPSEQAPPTPRPRPRPPRPVAPMPAVTPV